MEKSGYITDLWHRLKLEQRLYIVFGKNYGLPFDSTHSVLLPMKVTNSVYNSPYLRMLLRQTLALMCGS